VLYAAIVAQATNLGLTGMARASQFSYQQLEWAWEQYCREPTLTAASASLVDYDHQLPLAQASEEQESAQSLPSACGEARPRRRGGRRSWRSRSRILAQQLQLSRPRLRSRRRAAHANGGRRLSSRQFARRAIHRFRPTKRRRPPRHDVRHTTPTHHSTDDSVVQGRKLVPRRLPDGRRVLSQARVLPFPEPGIANAVDWFRTKLWPTGVYLHPFCWRPQFCLVTGCRRQRAAQQGPKARRG